MSELSDQAYWDDRARRWGPLAAGYRNAAMYQYEERLRWHAFMRRCRPQAGQRVLDLGCGPGRWSARLAELGCAVTAADISPEMLALAPTRDGINYVQGAAQDLELPDESFDLIVSVTVLQHITRADDFERALDNVARMLARSGRLAMIEFAPRRRGGSGAAHLVPRTRAEWLEAFRARGLDLVSETGIRFAGHGAFLIGMGLRSRLRTRDGLDAEGSPATLPGRLLRGAGQVVDLALQRTPAVSSLSPVRLLVLARVQP